VASDAIKKSSGLCLVASPKKGVSEEAKIGTLFSTSIVWLRS
jgi:hypothetical protein